MRVRSAAAAGGARKMRNVLRRGRSRLWRFGAIAEGELDDVVADIIRPAGNQPDKPPPVVGEQGPRGFLEAGQIAGHDRHEMIRRISCGAGAIQISARATRFLNELSDCY